MDSRIRFCGILGQYSMGIREFREVFLPCSGPRRKLGRTRLVPLRKSPHSHSEKAKNGKDSDQEIKAYVKAMDPFPSLGSLKINEF